MQAFAEKGVKKMYPWQAAALECGEDYRCGMVTTLRMPVFDCYVSRVLGFRSILSALSSSGVGARTVAL